MNQIQHSTAAYPLPLCAWREYALEGVNTEEFVHWKMHTLEIWATGDVCDRECVPWRVCTLGTVPSASCLQQFLAQYLELEEAKLILV